MQSKLEQPPFAPLHYAPFYGTAQYFAHLQGQFQARAFKALMRYQIEALTFLRHRCEQDVQLVEDLAAGKAPIDAVDIVSAFMQKAAVDYTAEAGRMATASSLLVSETAKDVRREAENAKEALAPNTLDE
ncbi:phasin family protein [Chelativorans sp. AA-79]|uniref:phasin family protein n=1 Tax=Chelativorans sp. AA-79 TaxID=3028735 RepID=UPI0023F865F6|nr:phasin family protein [Chelativorans sp. AA-79]WEX08202.1 phasin family protein [Chelativorans sp. AA-79]